MWDKNVLITGRLGFIGSHIVDELINKIMLLLKINNLVNPDQKTLQ